MKKIKQEKISIERESIGIENFDNMVSGGFPKGSVIGISGPPGVGKSIFSLHFLLEGARKGEKCVYINLEEPESNVMNMISQFEFSNEFFNFIKSGKIVIKCYTYNEYEKIYNDLFLKIKEDFSIGRLVIDSFNVFFSSVFNSESLGLSQEINVRKMINESFTILRRKNLTSLLVLETDLSKEVRYYYNIPYLVDGLISLDFLELGVIERRIFIPKMRWTSQSKEGKVFEINSQGITITD